MQSPTRNTEQVHQRSRCGDCLSYQPGPHRLEHRRDRGICAATCGDSKVGGDVAAAQTLCIFKPSKFKAKEPRP